MSSVPQQAVSPEYQILCRQVRDILEESNKTTTANTSNSTLDNTTDGVKEVLSEIDLKKGELESENLDTSYDLTTLFDEVGISNSASAQTVSAQTKASDPESKLFLYELCGLFDEAETETDDLFLHELSELFDDPDSPDETQGTKEKNLSDKSDYLHGLSGDSDSDDDLGFGLFDDDKWSNPKHQTTQKHVDSVTHDHCSDDDDDNDFLSSLFNDDFIAAATRLTVAPHANTCPAPTKTDNQRWAISAEHESDKKRRIPNSDCSHIDKTTNIHKTAMAVKTDSKPVVKRSDSEIDWCVICMDNFTDPKILDKCSHKFCQECINDYFKVRPQCPVCFVVYGVITGNQPKTGKMDHHIDHRLKLPGYEKYKTIVLYYNFPDGIQTEEHPYPGQEYYGTSRTAYLPNNDEGQKVHRLLKEAFKRRLVFTVGRSRTTGCDNQVTWNDIHHKTSPHGGQHGFGYPDPTYLSRVQEELAAFGVTEESIKANT